jgi:hypothetical protein
MEVFCDFCVSPPIPGSPGSRKGAVRYRSAAELRPAPETLPTTMRVDTTYTDTEDDACARTCGQ